MVNASSPHGGVFLVVEDDEPLARILATRFRSQCETVIAHTVAEAMTALSSKSDIVGACIDIGLPDGSGLTVIEQIKGQSRSTPVLALTGRADPELTGRLFELDAAYVRKPFAPTVLDTLVERVGTFCDSPDRRLRQAMDQIRADYPALTPREIETTKLVAQGMSRKCIAEHQGISMKTLYTHINRLLTKVAVACDTRPGTIGEFLGRYGVRVNEGAQDEDWAIRGCGPCPRRPPQPES